MSSFPFCCYDQTLKAKAAYGNFLFCCHDIYHDPKQLWGVMNVFHLLCHCPLFREVRKGTHQQEHESRNLKNKAKTKLAGTKAEIMEKCFLMVCSEAHSCLATFLTVQDHVPVKEKMMEPVGWPLLYQLTINLSFTDVTTSQSETDNSSNETALSDD